MTRNPPRTAPDFAAIHEQLRTHKHLTLQLLWEEYRQGNPDGYRYSRFCELYQWHEQIGDPTTADGILDRLVHNAHRIDMRGDSMRKKTRDPGVELTLTGACLRFGGDKDCVPFPAPLSREPVHSPLRSGQVFLDEAEHFPHNRRASVATLRRLFGFSPECRSRSLRNQRSPSPESSYSQSEAKKKLVEGRIIMTFKGDLQTLQKSAAGQILHLLKEFFVSPNMTMSVCLPALIAASTQFKELPGVIDLGTIR